MKHLFQKSSIKYIFSYAVTVLFIFLLYRSFNGWEIKSLIARMDFKYLALAMIALLIGYILRGYRWGAMLRRIDSSLSLFSCIMRFFNGMALNNILPLRAGDVYRLFCFKEYSKLNSANLLSTVVLERVFDISVLLGMFFISLHFIPLPILPPYLIHSVEILMILVLLIALILFSMPYLIKKLLNYLGSFHLMSNNAFLKKLFDLMHHFIDAIILIHSPFYILYLFGVSILAWVLEACVFLFSAQAMGYQGKLAGPFFAAAVGSLSTAIPSAPGNIGTLDYFTILGFKAFHMPESLAIASALLTHLVMWLPITLIGIFYMLIKTHQKKQPFIYRENIP